MNARSRQVHPRAPGGPVGSSARSTVPLGATVSMPEESRLLAILEHVPVGIAMFDPSGTVLLANPSYLAITGQDTSILGLRVGSFRVEGDSGLVDAVERVVSTRRPVTRREIPLTPETINERRVLDVELVPLLSASGEVSEILAIVNDVTSRVTEAERARLFYEAFQQSTNAMEVTDDKGILVDVNPAFERIYGYGRAEVIGRRPNVVSSRTTPRTLYEEMWTALLDPAAGHWSGEVVNQSRDGTQHPVLLSISAIRSGGRVSHFVGVAVDLSERRAWEQQALRSERLASLGTLSAGVAHELNTPLANIMLVAESVQRKSKEAWIRDRMSTIIGQTESAARIVRGLLDFSRRHEPQIRELNLSDVVRDAVDFIRGKQSEEVELAEEYARGPIAIRGDRDQLIQVFTNILNNGYEAIDGPGEIHVRVVVLDGSAEVSIEDSGPGIPASVLPHIFEPFFTTKSDRNGTGLGLAICHGIIQSHGGEIRAENSPGHGARFVVRFPLLKAHPESPTHGTHSAS